MIRISLSAEQFRQLVATGALIIKGGPLVHGGYDDTQVLLISVAGLSLEEMDRAVHEAAPHGEIAVRPESMGLPGEVTYKHEVAE